MRNFLFKILFSFTCFNQPIFSQDLVPQKKVIYQPFIGSTFGSYQVKLDKSTVPSSTAKIGLVAGLNVNIKIKNKWRLSTGFNYSQHNAILNTIYPNSPSPGPVFQTDKMKIDYLQIPLLLQYSASKPVAISFGLLPHYLLNIKDEWNTEIEIWSGSTIVSNQYNGNNTDLAENYPERILLICAFRINYSFKNHIGIFAGIDLDAGIFGTPKSTEGHDSATKFYTDYYNFYDNGFNLGLCYDFFKNKTKIEK